MSTNVCIHTDWDMEIYDRVPEETMVVAPECDCVYRLQRHVMDYFISHAPLQNSAEDYLSNLRVVEAIYPSSQVHQQLVIEN